MLKLVDGRELTDEVKEAFKRGVASAYIKLQDGTILSDSNYLKRLKIEELRYNEETENFIGEAVSKRLTLEIYNEYNSINLENKEFEAFIGAKLPDNTIAWINYGNFIVQKPENNDTKESSEIIAFDYMCKTNQIYVPGIEFPCTYGDLAEDVCNQCGLELGNKSFRNADKLVYDNFFINNEQCRVVIKEIAKIAFSWARVATNNKLYFDFEKKDIENSDEIFTLDDYIELELNDKTIPVNTIVLRNSSIESENITIKDNALIAEYGQQKELVIKEDYFAYSQEKRQELIEAARELIGLVYNPITVKSIGTIYLESNDIIVIEDKQGNKKGTYCFNHTIDFNGVLYDNIESPAMTETQTKYQHESSEDLSRRRTEILVNKATQQISLISEKVDTYDSRISSLEIDLEGIQAKVESQIDITRVVEGIQRIVLENCMAGELLELHIYGNNSVFKRLYPSNDLYPSDSLYPLGDSLIKITRQETDIDDKIIKEESEIIDLQLTEELRHKNNVTDEIALVNNKLKVIRRIGVNQDGNTYIKEVPTIESERDLKILTFKGNLIIEILNYSALISAKYVTVNEYTNIFATTVEMYSVIEQTAKSIGLEVKQITDNKVGNNEIFARMNMYIRGLGDQTDIPDDIPRSVIEFFSNSFSWDSDNSSLSPDGILILRNKTTEPYKYTINDVLAAQSYIKGTTSLTPELVRLYDATGDGIIDIRDINKMLNIINGSEQSDKYANATIILNPKNPTEFITMKLEDAIQCKIGLNEIYNYTFRGMNMFLGTYADMNNQYGVSINGEKGIITVRSEDAQTETRIDAGYVDAYYVSSSSRNKKGYCMHGTNLSHDYLCNWNGSHLQFYVDDTNVGELSDERVKSDIEKINEKLILIAEELNLKQFKLANKNGKISIGVIAQELLELFDKYELNPDDFDFTYDAQFKLDDETIYHFVNYEQLLILQNFALKRKIEKQEKQISYIIEKLGIAKEMEDFLNGK